MKLAAEFTKGTVARGVCPSLNVTVPPLAVPPSAGVTVATKVAGCVTVCGLAELASTTALWESTTFSLTAADGEGARFVLPVKTAVRLWSPTDRLESGSVALPLPSTGTDASNPVPSKKVTLPDGTPTVEATRAVSRMVEALVAGFNEMAKVVCVGALSTS